MPCDEQRLHDIDDDDWARALAREPIIRQLASLSQITRTTSEAAGIELGLKRTQIFALVKRYREDPVTSSLVDHKAGWTKGARRLDSQVEALIDEELEARYLTRPAPKISKVHRNIRLICKSRKLSAPAYGTVQARAEELDKRRALQAREGKKAADDKYRPVTSEYEAEHALHIAQMDHTLTDIEVVDEIFRLTIGRPWISLLIDIATRYILGFYLSLEHPSSVSVAMAVRQAVLSKDQWLADRELDVEWLAAGLFDFLHLDNAREFRSAALKRGCDQYSIKLTYRPVRTPHYGGHIERLIGTQMGEVHLLPGTTFSNIQEKGDYDSGRKAVLTLAEFEKWFTIQVAVYNNTIHSALKIPPRIAWMDLIKERPKPVRLPQNPEQFLYDFLPFKQRKIRRTGIQLSHIFYWDNILTNMVGRTNRKLRVKYNPRDLSVVFLEDLDGHHWPIHYRDLRRPPITLFEHQRATEALRKRGHDTVDEELIFSMINEQRCLVVEAANKTKTARRTVQRIVNALDEGVRVRPDSSTPALIAQKPPLEDSSDEAVIPFMIEERP